MNHYWRINTSTIIVPDALQRDTGLPGDPQGNYYTGYARTKAELKDLARLDRREARYSLKAGRRSTLITRVEVTR